MSSPIVKFILPGMTPTCMQEEDSFGPGADFEWDGVRFVHDPACRRYDWLVVYDDMPKQSVGSICREVEPLACPPEQTILVTAEPPSIKLYPRCYTRQFGHVLTTHAPLYLPHPHRRYAEGSLRWMAGYTRAEVLSMPEYPKSKLLSTVCSSKAMRRTRHHERLGLIRHLSAHLPELEWYGWGMRPIKKKYHALNDYAFHIAIENYISPHHWTDKITDPLLALCLTFYAGDPLLTELLPEGSFIPIPLNDPDEALSIIHRTLTTPGVYEKHLPAIREARRLIITRYNLYSRCAGIIRSTPWRPGGGSSGGSIAGRHHLRRSLPNALQELGTLLRFRALQPPR
ncbi:MAG: hypothetical protein J1E42_07325 [Akkermansiaceae bacterium]|nr:hypothetical protein [Akkermansiaceae bacterium]